MIEMTLDCFVAAIREAVTAAGDEVARRRREDMPAPGTAGRLAALFDPSEMEVSLLCLDIPVAIERSWTGPRVSLLILNRQPLGKYRTHLLTVEMEGPRLFRTEVALDGRLLRCREGVP